MDNQMTDLLGVIATKLGTTVEKLWGVLLKQAPISGVTDLVVSLVLILVLVLAFRFIQKQTTEDPETHCTTWDPETGGMLAWVGFTLLGSCVMLVLAIDAEYIVASFLNPDYWALHQLQHLMGK